MLWWMFSWHDMFIIVHKTKIVAILSQTKKCSWSEPPSVSQICRFWDFKLLPPMFLWHDNHTSMSRKRFFLSPQNIIVSATPNHATYLLQEVLTWLGAALVIIIRYVFMSMMITLPHVIAFLPPPPKALKGGRDCSWKSSKLGFNSNRISIVEALPPIWRCWSTDISDERSVHWFTEMRLLAISSYLPPSECCQHSPDVWYGVFLSFRFSSNSLIPG